jgi:hypothetical protein
VEVEQEVGRHTLEVLVLVLKLAVELRRTAGLVALGLEKEMHRLEVLPLLVAAGQLRIAAAAGLTRQLLGVAMEQRTYKALELEQQLQRIDLGWKQPEG